MITFKETINLIKEDLVTYEEPFIKAVLFVPGYKYTFHQRLCYYFSQKKIYKPLFILWWLYMKHLTYQFGIQTAWNFALPRHFTIAHFGGITFFPRECGRDCYLRQGVTVGNASRDPNKRHPKIGNNVTFGANAIVIGDIEIGDNVIIAAGAVVTKSVPDNCVVAGVPAKVVKHIDSK